MSLTAAEIDRFRASQNGLRAVVDASLFLVALGWALWPVPDPYTYREALTRLAAIEILFVCAWGIRGGGLSPIDVVALTALLLPSYALIYPLLYLKYPFALFGLGESAFHRVFDAHTGVVLSFWFVALFADTARSRGRLSRRLRTGLAGLVGRVANCNPFLPSVLVLTLTAVYVRHLIQTGGLGVFTIRNRTLFYQMTGDLEWWKVKFAIVGLTIFLLLYAAGQLRRAPPERRMLSVLICLFSALPYLVVSIAVGNRREPILVVLSVFLIVFALGSRLRRFWTLLLTGAALAGMLYLGIWRSSPSRANAETATLVVLGEFVFPYQATLVALEPGRRILYGGSYLQPLLMFVPRAAWSGKPSPLAERFIDEVGTRGVLGYGYTPLAEAVANFGSLGPFVLGVMFAGFLFYVRRNALRFPLLYLLVFAEMVGFHRGEFATVVSEIILLALIVVLSIWIAGPSPYRTAFTSDKTKRASP